MSGAHGGGDPHNKKRFAVIGVSICMLVAMVVAVVVGVKNTRQGTETAADHSHDDDVDVASSHKAVHSLCQPTDYRKICEKALSHSNTSDPKQLIQTGFNAAIEQIEGALNRSSTIKAAHDDKRAPGALETCKEVMEYALGDLKRSVNTMGKFDISELGNYVDHINIWLSGALTFHETCFDAFENTTSDAGEKMKKLLNVSRELTSNGLVMATELSVVFGSAKAEVAELGHMPRPLSQMKGAQEHKEAPEHKGAPGHKEAAQPKQEEYPSWVDIGKQKLFQMTGTAIKADVVVAKDGSGKYKTITEALKDVPVKEPTQVANSANKTFVIYIKAGVYEEQVRVEANMMNVMFIGDGPSKTVITGNKSFADGIVVYKTATVSIIGSNFIAKDIGFENSAGPEKHQAVALLVQSDMSIFYNCHINGYKSTLFAHSYRQFYRHCLISGTIDIIFGDAAAVFQNSKLVIRKPINDEQCYVAAQGRVEPKAATGFVLQNCTFTAAPLYYPLKNKNKAYLGRPWKKFSRTIIMQSSIDDAIDAQGWAPWMGNFGTDTCYLAEFENRGPGAATSGRVEWAGVKVNISAKEVEEFTAGKFIGGDKWILPSKVPYESGLMKI